MQHIILGALALASAALASAQTPAGAASLGGQVRLQWVGQSASSSGPLAQANALQNGIVDLPVGTAALETELRASGHGLTGIVTLQQQMGHRCISSNSRERNNSEYSSNQSG